MTGFLSLFRYGAAAGLTLVLASFLVITPGCGSTSDPVARIPTGAGGSGGGSTIQACDPIGTELLDGTAPSQRADMAFAFDPVCRRVMMWFGDMAVPVNCGPAGSQFLSDGYVYDTITGRWSEIEVTGGGPSPLPRARSRGVWDEKRGRFILFGGRYRDGSSGPYTFLNDVWAFDPATKTWEELSPLGDAAGRPNGRMNFSLDADPERDRILLHGGGTIAADFTKYHVDSDTWAFDLETRTWAQLAITGPQPTARLFHGSAFDRTNQRLFVFAGGGENAFTSPSFFRDTWYLDLTQEVWTQVPSDLNDPTGRIKPEMIYDAARSRILLFGGHDDGQLGNTNDIWSLKLDTLTWKLEKQGDVFSEPAFGLCDFPADFAIIDPLSPERRESHLFDVSEDVAIMYGGRTDCGIAKDSWSLDLTTLEWTQLNESFVGMTCRRSGSLNCDDPEARLCI